MKYGYDLDKKQRITVEPIALYDHRKQSLSELQLQLIESQNPHLFAKADKPSPESEEGHEVTPTPSILLNEFALVMVNPPTAATFLPEKTNVFNRAGIAKKFSQLKDKTMKDTVAFANEYGLLGCKLVDDINILDSSMAYLERFSYHHSYFEPLKVWWWHIDHINKLFSLYRAMRYDTQIENKVLRVEHDPSKGFAVGSVYWADGKLAGLYAGGKEINYKLVARQVLVWQLSRMLKGAIDPSFDSIVNDEKSELGFKIIESHRTSFLLAAIYYDLWQTVKSHQAVSACEHCGAAFTPSKRRMFCSNACKQAAYRKNKEGVKTNG